MIEKNDKWYLISKDSETFIEDYEGMWLYFGKTEIIHSWIDTLEKVVNENPMRISISVKKPFYDDFPKRDCVLCVHTLGNESLKIKELLENIFRIEIHVWKTYIQTDLDWQENGILKIEFDLNRELRKIQEEGIFFDSDNIKSYSNLLTILENRIAEEISKDKNRLVEFEFSGILKALLLYREEENSLRRARIYPLYFTANKKKTDINEVKKLISKSKLSEAITILYSYFEHKDKDKAEALLLISSRFSHYERNENMGLSTDKLERNSITQSILYLIRDE